MGHTDRHRHRIGMPGRTGDVMPRIRLLGSYCGLNTSGKTILAILAAISGGPVPFSRPPGRVATTGTE
jgi:hypothetical protein